MGGSRMPEGYWHSNLRLTGALLLLWVAITFVEPYFAAALDFRFFGWPFSFWMAAQGTPLLYVLLVVFYARRMERLDAQHGVAEEEAP